jgi:hypothetical protein
MASKSIVLRGEPIVDEQQAASTAITPGHLIEKNNGQWRPHATAAGAGAAIFALERDELGNDIDTAYASGDYVKAAYPAKGDRINALIASGQDLHDGDQLESAGDGTLRALSGTNPVARSAEDSGAVTALTRHKVYVI